MMRHHPQCPCRTGFTITEVLMTLSLLVIFFGAAGEVFKSTVLLSSAGAQLSDQTAQTDSAIFQLRQDVWNSRSITIDNPCSLDLISTAGSTISWKVFPDHSLTRAIAQSPPEHWPSVAAGWSFSVDHATLILSDGTPVPIRLISQLLLAQRSVP